MIELDTKWHHLTHHEPVDADTGEVVQTMFDLFVMDGVLYVKDDSYDAYPTMDQWCDDTNFPTENAPQQ